MNEQELFAKATVIDSADARSEFLDAACQGNPELRSRVERLLKLHACAGSFLEHPAVKGISTEMLPDPTDDVATNTEGSRTTPHVDDIPLDFLDAPRQPGSLGRLGQYDILEAVGRGGMGIVLKAQDAKLNRVVAVKVLAPELASNPTARKRFLREAQAAAAVSHDHVVTIYAVEDGDGSAGLPYLVMEFIDGQSLQEKIDQHGALELKEILRIGRQIASGLAAAHEQGLIHRDVKPSNILLQNGVQRVQITDFGLARAVDDIGMTRTGEITGTPQYMSPEQAQGQPVDARSDLFSLGSVLYSMCTGRSPFRADTSVASLRRVCDDTPRPIREVNPDIPEWLVPIIERLLEKDAANRIQTAEEVAQLLGKHLAHLQDPGSTPFPGTVRPVKRHSVIGGRRQRWLVAGLVLLAVATSFGVTEGTGVTQVTHSVISIVRGDGTLIVEVDDPAISITIEGNDLVITGAGPQEVRLSPGSYFVQAVRDGEIVTQEMVTITRRGRKVVSVTLQSASSHAETDSELNDALQAAAVNARLERWDEAAADALLALEASSSEILDPLHMRPVYQSLFDKTGNRDELFSRLVDARPDDMHLWVERARYFARYHDWSSAAHHYAHVFDSFQPDLSWGAPYHTEYACLLVLSGDQAAFKAFCQTLVNDVDESNVYQGYVLGRICCVSPDSGVPAERVLALLEPTLASEDWVDYLTYSIGQLRAGHYDEAIATVESEEIPPRPSAFILALAHHHLGHTEEAAASHEKAMRGFSTSPLEADGNIGYWLLLQTLRREALRVFDPDQWQQLYGVNEETTNVEND